MSLMVSGADVSVINPDNQDVSEELVSFQSSLLCAANMQDLDRLDAPSNCSPTATLRSSRDEHPPSCES